LNADLLKQGHR